MGFLKEFYGWRNSGKNYDRVLGKEIVALGVENDVLSIFFIDGDWIKFSDEGQSCCEHRYMNTDDDLCYHIGSKFLNARKERGPMESEDEYGCVQTEFLLIDTSCGTFTVCNYNKHNGYYGGFSVQVAVNPEFE